MSNIINRLLGENDEPTPFSEEFTDTLDLMRKVCELENLWWDEDYDDEDGDEDRDEDGKQDGGNAVDQLANVLFDYGHKHGEHKYGSDIVSAAERHMTGRRISDDFWADLRGDIAITAGRAVKSGDLQPYMGLLQSVLSGDPFSEKYGSVWDAIEDASGMDVSDFLEE